MDPTMVQAGAQVLSAALGGSGPAAPSSSDGNAQRFDNSGWVVHFGDGDIETTRDETQPMQKWLPYVLAGITGIVALVWLKKRKP